MKSIKVQYFALLREQAGVENEELNLNCETYADLYEHLKVKYGFTLPLEMIQVAVNDEFFQMNGKITDQSRVVFIPPVAGG